MARLAVVAFSLLALGYCAADVVNSADVEQERLVSQTSLQDLQTDGLTKDKAHSSASAQPALDQQSDSDSADHKPHDGAPVRSATGELKDTKDSAQVGKATDPGVMQKGYGNYQQSTGKYAADYQKYISQGGQGSSSGNLPQYAQQYVKQGASSFGGYVERPGQQQSQGDMQGADQYMKGGAGQGQPGGTTGSQQGGAGGDYQKYMQSGSGGGQQAGASGNYQKYTDYQKYMQGGAGGGQQGGNAEGLQSGAGGGDHQKYISLYAASYRNDADHGYQSNESVDQSKGQGGDYKAYIQKYAGDFNKYMGQGQGGHGSQRGSQGGDYQKYMKQSAADYQQHVKKNLTQMNSEHALEAIHVSAAKCKTEGQLKAWRRGQEDQIQQWVPASFRQTALKPVSREYSKSLARIRASSKVATGLEDHSDDVTGHQSTDSDKSRKPVEEDGKHVEQDGKAVEDTKDGKHVEEDGQSSDNGMGVSDDIKVLSSDANRQSGSHQEIAAADAGAPEVNAVAESASAENGRTGIVTALLLAFGFALPAGGLILFMQGKARQLQTHSDLGTPFVDLDAMP